MAGFNPTTNILMPSLRHRFRVFFLDIPFHFLPDLSIPREKSEDDNILTTQIKNFSIDLVNSTITFEIRDACNDSIYNSIINFVAHGPYNNRIVLENTTGGNDGYFTRVFFNRVKAIKHELVYDYADSDVATHKITCNFNGSWSVFNEKLLKENSNEVATEQTGLDDKNGTQKTANKKTSRKPRQSKPRRNSKSK